MYAKISHFIKNPTNLPWLILSGMLLLAFIVRLVDLKDPPLDFNPTRQMRAAILTRGIYYELLPNADPELKAQAVAYKDAISRYEPPILESLVALNYKIIGGEAIWVVRIYNTIFWLIGGLFLYLISRRMHLPWGGLVGVGYYLFLPFSIYASRSFQPEAWMIMWIVLAAYALTRWAETRFWKWAILAGLLGGIATLVKIMAAFFVGAMAVAVVLQVDGLRRSFLNRQVWLMAGLLVLPSFGYYILGSSSGAADYANTFTAFSDWRDLIAPSFYIRWALWIHSIFGLTAIITGLVGTLLIKSKIHRSLLLSLWVGYGIHGVFFPEQTPTHDYYHIALLPILALGLPPIADTVIENIQSQGKFARLLLVGIALFSIALPAWVARSTLVGQTFDQAEPYWETVGKSFPANEKTVAATQDYGLRLMYYGWRKISLWPQTGGMDDFEENTRNARFFLITAKNQIKDEVKDYLEDNFPVYAEGGGYIVYDLKGTKN